MKVLHINTYTFGGAALAALKLHKLMLKHGINSKMLVLGGSYNDCSNIYLYKDSNRWFKKRFNLIIKIIEKILSKLRIINRAAKAAQRISKKVEYYSSPITIYKVEEHPLVKEADIIQLHWIADFINYSTFFKKINKPIFWYFHDMNPLLGGVHYSLDTFKLQKNLLPYDDYFKKIKNDSIKRCNNLHIFTNSNWLKNETIKSIRFKNSRSIETIHYSFDFDLYKPINKEMAKECLGLNKNNFVLCFGADGVDKERKGFLYLKEALKHLKNIDNLVILTFGGGQINLEPDVNLIQFGKIQSINLLRIIYSAADIFLIPSVQEAFGQVGVEALGCGTPVIGFKNTGVEDYIIDNQNGYLIDFNEKEQIAKKILYLYDNRDYLKFLSSNCRESVINKFDNNVQLSKILSSYNNVLKKESC